MYDTLKRLPLFQGLGSSELQDIIGKVRFGFAQYKKGQTVIRKGETCRGLIFLMKGSVEIITTDDEGKYELAEYAEAPVLFEPERLFGLKQHYTCKCRAASQCNVLTVRKDDVMKLSTDYLVFRMNILNIISTVGQRAIDITTPKAECGTRKRMENFVNRISRTQTWPKVLRIKMQTLAEFLSLPRLEISKELNRMDSEGKITLQRGIITFNDSEWTENATGQRT